MRSALSWLTHRVPHAGGLIVLFLVAACGADAPPPAEGGGDPTAATYAPDLGVDIAAMQRLDSGLYIRDLAEGTGEEVGRGQQAIVHYTGWLPSGEEFDSSRGGDPFDFEVGAGNVIQGWDEGVEGMRVGGQRQLVIPAELAYGDRGAGGVIPPGAVLVFDVELLGVQ